MVYNEIIRQEQKKIKWWENQRLISKITIDKWNKMVYNKIIRRNKYETQFYSSL